jgi:hypothetical protein
MPSNGLVGQYWGIITTRAPKANGLPSPHNVERRGYKNAEESEITANPRMSFNHVSPLKFRQPTELGAFRIDVQRDVAKQCNEH